MNVLFISAHADDEIAYLGTLNKHAKRGDKVKVIIASNGEALGNPEQRMEDSKRTLEKFGAEVKFLGLQDTMITENRTTITLLELHTKGITRAYIHTPNDTHQDHRNLSRASMVACRNVPQIFRFESPSNTKFRPNWFVEIKKFINKKVSLMQKYKLPGKQWYMETEAIKGTAMHRGVPHGLKYAEAFEVVRYVEKN